MALVSGGAGLVLLASVLTALAFTRKCRWACRGFQFHVQTKGPARYFETRVQEWYGIDLLLRLVLSARGATRGPL